MPGGYNGVITGEGFHVIVEPERQGQLGRDNAGGELPNVWCIQTDKLVRPTVGYHHLIADPVGGGKEAVDFLVSCNQRDVGGGAKQRTGPDRCPGICTEACDFGVVATLIGIRRKSGENGVVDRSH
jgi:hypothetical protein